jgi:hypothetical protein
MKMTPARLADLKRLGYYVEENNYGADVVVALKKPRKKTPKPAAPAEAPYIGPKKWTFVVNRDDFGFIESIDATEIT